MASLILPAIRLNTHGLNTLTESQNLAEWIISMIHPGTVYKSHTLDLKTQGKYYTPVICGGYMNSS